MDKDIELKKKLEVIIEKRKNCIPLTREEDIFVEKFYSDLHDAKFGVKKTIIKTGDEIRKASSFEGTPPKNRGFVGGYDRKADVERTELSRDGKNTAGEPTRKDADYFSVEGKQTPKEDTSGSIKADYKTEEYADTDNKKYVPQYEETRLADQIEGQHQYENSIRVKDLVTKSVGHLGKQIKLVGQVYKTYKNGRALLVKWANGVMSHELTADLSLLKLVHPKTAKEEDKAVSPPVRKHTAAEKLAQALHRADTHFGKAVAKKPGIFSPEAMAQSEAVRSPGKRPARTGPVGFGANAGETAGRAAGFMAGETVQAAKTRGARLAGPAGGFADRLRDIAPKKMADGTDTEKGAVDRLFKAGKRAIRHKKN